MSSEPPIKREMQQVFERVGIARQQLARAGLLQTPEQKKKFNEEMELLTLSCFLKHTIFWGRWEQMTPDRMNGHVERFKREGRIVARGWMLEREWWSANPDTPSWKLSVAP